MRAEERIKNSRLHLVETDKVAGFLDAIQFTHFCTFTTRKPISLASTRRIAEVVGKHIDAGGQSTMFWAAEPFDVREGYHFHALLRTHIPPVDLYGWYFPRYGRCQVIDNTAPERRLAASYYCSKYMTKYLADYDYYPGNEIRNRHQIKLQ